MTTIDLSDIAITIKPIEDLKGRVATSVREQCLDDLDWTISEAQHTYRGHVSTEQKIELLQTMLLATVNRARLVRLIV